MPKCRECGNKRLLTREHPVGKATMVPTVDTPIVMFYDYWCAECNTTSSSPEKDLDQRSDVERWRALNVDHPDKVLFQKEAMQIVCRSLVDHMMSEFDLVELLRVIGTNADNGFFLDQQIETLKIRQRCLKIKYPWWEEPPEVIDG